MTDERAIAFLRELARADEAAAATLRELDELEAEARRIGERALALDARLRELPAAHESARRARGEAQGELVRRREAHEREAARLRAAEERGEGVDPARRGELRARDLARTAARRLAAAEAEEARLVDEEARGERDARALVARARELAGAVRERPGLGSAAGAEAGATLADVARWATEARAALFVARGRLAAEREALIRQANELGTVVLGEPLASQSAALVARRVDVARP